MRRGRFAAVYNLRDMAERDEPGVAQVDAAGAAAAKNGVVRINGASVNGHTTRPGGRGVLVLNASYEPINVCTVRRAAVLVLKERAEMLERGEGALHSERLDARAPLRDPADALRAHPA